MIPPPLCPFCGHEEHPVGEKCALCKCKGKPGFWRGVYNAVGNAIGNLKFGGN